jgi:predicted TIM-barrel fold metal-dependent hydrolase
MVATHYTTDPIKVVDADSHLTEPPWLWVDHAPAKLKDRVPRVVEDEQGRPRWIVDQGTVLGPMGYSTVAPDDSRIEGDFVVTQATFENVHRGAYDFRARLGWLDGRGIYQQVLFPNTLAGFGGARFFTAIDDSALRTACITIYNDAAAEIQRESGGRLLPLAMVPWWDVEKAAQEVSRARTELDLRGITMPDNPHDYGFPKLHRPEWQPFWSACEDAGMAVAFHIGGGTFQPNTWVEPGEGEAQATQTSNSFLANSWLVANLIFSGVLLRHPRLKIFSAETGIGWMPFLIESMDYHWHELITARAKSEVWNNLLPSEIFRRNIWVSFWFEQWGPAHAIDFIGEDNVMFETDFPHGTSLTPRTTQQVAQTLATLKPEVRRKVLHDNAARLYSLPA